MTQDQDQRVRMFIFGETAKTGRVPTASEIADGLRLSVDDAHAALNRLAAGRVLDPRPWDHEHLDGQPIFSSAHPISCAREGADLLRQLHLGCPGHPRHSRRRRDRGNNVRRLRRSDGARGSERYARPSSWCRAFRRACGPMVGQHLLHLIDHVALPVGRAIDRWCKHRVLPRGATVTLEQCWQLAREWYADKLSPAPIQWQKRSKGAASMHFPSGDLGTRIGR